MGIWKAKSNKGKVTDDMVDEWERMYVEEGKSTIQIGNEYGMSYNTVTQHLKDRGIKMRGRGKLVKEDMVDEWVNMYVEEEKSTVDIAREYDVVPSTVLKHLKRRGVEIRGPRKVTEDMVDEWVELYTEENRSTSEIAEEYDIASSTVTKYLNKRGIELKR